jgi:hypothetical protein
MLGLAGSLQPTVLENTVEIAAVYEGGIRSWISCSSRFPCTMAKMRMRCFSIGSIKTRFYFFQNVQVVLNVFETTVVGKSLEQGFDFCFGCAYRSNLS